VNAAGIPVGGDGGDDGMRLAMSLGVGCSTFMFGGIPGARTGRGVEVGPDGAIPGGGIAEAEPDEPAGAAGYRLPPLDWTDGGDIGVPNIPLGFTRSAGGVAGVISSFRICTLWFR
jgi:hypothetical protein